MPPPKSSMSSTARSKPPARAPAREPPPASASDTSSSEVTTSEDESSEESPPTYKKPSPGPPVPRKSPPKNAGEPARPALTRGHTAPPLRGNSRASIASIQTLDSVETQSSIRDDPFFRSYQSPQSVRFAKDTAKIASTGRAGGASIDAALKQGRRGSEATIKASDESNRTRKASVADSVQEPFPSGDPHAGMREINIVVVGDSGVGKTTFMQKAHDLRLPPKSAQCARGLLVDGVVQTIRMIEMGFSDSLIDNDRRILWPRRVDGELLPPVDGVLCLYDVLNEDSITWVPDLLEALVKANIPTLLVSCKCDIPVASRQIDPNVIEQVGTMFGGVQAVQTSANVPETQKKALGKMIRMVADVRKQLSNSGTTRRRANSTFTGPDGATSTYTGGRRSSETAGMTSQQTASTPGRSGSVSGPEGRAGRRGSATELAETGPPNSFADYAGPGTPGLAVVSELPFKANSSRELYDEVDPKEGRSGDRGSSFLDTREEEEDDTQLEEEMEVMSIDDASLAEMPVKNPGITWDDLLDRLVAQPLSKADTNFITIFLTLYRKFAAPADLLDGILARFTKTNSDENPHLIRMTSQLRYLGVLTNWLANYPGDFCHMRTRNRLKQFTEHISNNRVFAVAAKEMRAHLEVIVEDDDSAWGKTDSERYRRSTTASQLTVESTTSTIVRRPSEAQVDMGDSVGDMSSQFQRRGSESNPNIVPSHSRGSSVTFLNRQDSFDREGVPGSVKPVPKEVYKAFMEIPDEDVANELTFMDWQFFSAFRSRDLVRHISMSAVQREKCRSLEHVERMIRQFNFTAFWVGNMICLRDKPKHRALMLEKFMRIARVSLNLLSILTDSDYA